MSDYYCWLQYYDKDTAKQTSSSEIRYYQGHKHGIQPSANNWNDCLDDLVLVVNGVRNPPLKPLSKEVISKDAERKTRSAH